MACNLTYGGEHRGGVVEGSGKLPGLPGLVGLLQVDDLLQKDEVRLADLVLVQHLLLQLWKKKTSKESR